MNNIDIELIKKYINGEELGEYNEQELEDDMMFMYAVMSYTNNPSIIALCSDRLRSDYHFVKSVINKFKDDYDAIRNIANYYLEKSNNEIDKLELNIIMTKLLPMDESIDYTVYSNSVYAYERLGIEKAKMLDKELEDYLEEGFVAFYEKYANREIILNYFSKCMIKDIIKYNDINLERKLHYEFNSKEELEEKGEIAYLIELFSRYDSTLGYYLGTHKNNLKEYVKEVKKIERDWNGFIKRDDKNRYLDMFDMVHNYLSITNSTLEEIHLINYISKELNVLDKAKEYEKGYFINDDEDYYYDVDYDEYEKDKIEEIDYLINNNIQDRKIYLAVKKIMKAQLFKENPGDLYETIWKEQDLNEKKKDKLKSKVRRIDS